MALELKKDKMQNAEKIAEATVQQNIDFDASLPDYCSDVKKILKCVVTPGVGNVSVSTSGVTVSGTVTTRLIYISEKDKIDCYENTKEFSVEIKAKDIPSDADVKITAKTNYTNCRAISQRKISISANVGIGLTAFYPSEKEIITDVSGCAVQCKKKKVEYQQLLCQRQKVFELGETAAVPEGKAPIGKILRVNAYAVIDSKKAVSDKLLIKGEMYTEIFYITDEQPSSFERFKHSMPISQIIDMPGIDEKSQCSAEVGVRQVMLNIKQDSSSSNRLLEIAAKLCADIKCSLQKSADIIEDTYSISHEIETEYKIQEFLCPVHTIDRQKTHKTTVEIIGGSIRQILDIWCNELLCTIKGKDDKVEGICSASLGILYLDEKDCPAYTEKTVEFDVPVKLSQKYEFLKCNMSAHIRNIDFKLSSKDKIDVSLEVGLLAEIFSAQSYRILDTVAEGDKKLSTSDAALTLCFAFKGEKLWDIARKYNTTVSLITQENTLEGEELSEDCMLMIPSAQ